MTPDRFGDYLLRVRLPSDNELLERYRASPVEDPEAIVVLTHLARWCADDPEVLAWFWRDATHAPKLSHRNLRKALSAGGTSEAIAPPFLLEEHLDAESLEALLLRRRGHLPPVFAVHIAAAICTALAYLHEQRDTGDKPLVHRNLQPPNVLLTYQGEVKLDTIRTILQRQRYSSYPGRIVLRFNYFSPEMVIGLSVDGRSDIFSLGAILYEMLTGRVAFPGDGSDFSILEEIRDARFNPFTSEDDVPEALREIITKSLARDPAQRYQSAAEMEKALRLFLGEHPEPITRDDLSVFLRLVCGGGAEHLSSLLQEELSRLEKIRWLSPDSKMEDANEDAISWLDARFDEHLSALTPYSVNRDLPTARVEIVRSMHEARERLEVANERTAPQEIFQWRRAIEASQRRVARLVSATEEAKSSCQTVIQAALRAVSLPSDAPEALLHWWGERPPMSAILEAHFSFLFAFRDKLVSPWSPLIALWEQGVWPVAVLADGLLVYVPVLRDGALVPWPRFPNSKEPLPPLDTLWP
jgi:serine/threonine protein kinase